MRVASYWERHEISRRVALRGATAGFLGLAGAALVGCSSGSKTPAAPGGSAPGAAAGDASKPVPADQVRLKAGQTYSGIFPTAAEQNPLVNAKRGGTYKFRIFDSPSMDFNKILSSTVNTPNDLTKNKLFRLALGPKVDPGAIGIEGDLVEAFENTKDATQFTLKLRKGVKFHNVKPTNGRELNAEDVKISIERYKAGGVQKDVFAQVISMELPDPYTVVVKLDQPLAEFPRIAASWSYIDAKEMIADNKYLSEHAVGTGPFIQSSWVPKDGQEFVRHPDYFEKGLPFLEKVSGKVIDDDNVLQSAFATENIFNYEASTPESAKQLLKQASKSVLFEYKGSQGANVNGFHFQMKNPKWQDERVRRAFSMAFDRKDWAVARFGDDAANSGNGYSTGPIAWSVLHDKVPDLSTQGPYYQYNPAEATKMLAAAGYTKEKPITAEMSAWFARLDWGDILVPALNKLGPIKATFKQVDNPTAVTILNGRNFDDITNITWGPPAYAVDQTLYPWYHSKGGLNHNNHNDPTIDQLVTAQRQELDPKKQKEIWQQAQNRIYDQVWEAFTPVNFQRRGMFHNYVLNFRQNGLGALTTYCTAQMRWVWLDNI